MPSKMQLGSYDFEWSPTQFTVPKKDKRFSIVQTYSTAAYFSWGVSSIGKELVIEWEMMTEAEFDQLQTMLEADQAYDWTPEVGVSGTYSVEVCQLEGQYMDKSVTYAPYRTNVKLMLMLKVEV